MHVNLKLNNRCNAQLQLLPIQNASISIIYAHLAAAGDALSEWGWK